MLFIRKRWSAEREEMNLKVGQELTTRNIVPLMTEIRWENIIPQRTSRVPFYLK